MWEVLVSSNHFNSYVWHCVWLLTAETALQTETGLACLGWGEMTHYEFIFLKVLRIIRMLNRTNNRKYLQSLILCHFSLPVHSWLSINSTLICFSPFFYSVMTHLWSSLIRSLLVSTKTIDLSSLPPSQSSVDHKEFKRCGPFDPYINAKVCTQCCLKTTFLLKCFLCFYSVLACWAGGFVAAAALGSLCCWEVFNFTQYESIPGLRFVPFGFIDNVCNISNTVLQHANHLFAKCLLFCCSRLLYRIRNKLGFGYTVPGNGRLSGAFTCEVLFHRVRKIEWIWFETMYNLEQL